jgi:Reverse transcriptase (RNA-dependent DNA polymerase)
LQEHECIGSFKEVKRSDTTGKQVLGCMWVFTYKLDKHGFLVKCKARLVVCGNQQEPRDLPTRATTLASTTFRTLMAIIAQFDLETRQLDIVNAFVNYKLDEVVYIRLLPGFEKPGKVFLLRKALYGLRRSLLLWQTKLTEAFRSLGFTLLAQGPCVALMKGVVAFYYVDDIVFIYREKDKALADETITGLKRQIRITDYKELKWFLGIHILRDRRKRLL